MSGGARGTTPADPIVDRSERLTGVGRLLVLACGLIGAAITFAFIQRDRAEPFILGLLGILAVIGVFTLFAGAIGFLRIDLSPPVSTPRRRGDNHRFAGFQHRLVAAFECFDRSIEASDCGRSEFAVIAACQTVRPDGAVRRQDRTIHLFEKTDGPFGAAAGRIFALAAGPFADVKILKQNRKPEFENFRIGEARIGHMG